MSPAGPMVESASPHASGPERRTMPRGAGPGALAMATIVSTGSRSNGAARRSAPLAWPAPRLASAIAGLLAGLLQGLHPRADSGVLRGLLEQLLELLGEPATAAGAIRAGLGLV